MTAARTMAILPRCFDLSSYPSMCRRCWPGTLRVPPRKPWLRSGRRRMLQQKYLIIAEKAENNYAAYSPDVPGCVAAADSLGECIDLMREALFYHFELMAQRGKEIP